MIAAACAATACVGPFGSGSTADSPAWLDERIAAAEASERGFPRLEDVPDYTVEATSNEQWRRGVADLTAIREAVLNDPAMADPDLDSDAATFARESRAATARDQARQTVDDDE